MGQTVIRNTSTTALFLKSKSLDEEVTTNFARKLHVLISKKLTYTHITLSLCLSVFLFPANCICISIFQGKKISAVTAVVSFTRGQ